MSKPIVALVGRPNVGKSTLFNRLVGSRTAIVDDTSGVTRDRIYREADWAGHSFLLVDTGGLVPESKEEMQALVENQAKLAIAEADVVIFLVDGKSGVTGPDEQVANLLRRTKKPVILAVNKVDEPHEEVSVPEFYRLGLGEPYSLSAMRGTGGVGDLLDVVVSHFPNRENKAGKEEFDTTDNSPDSFSLAIVGRPNVGKSSILNVLCGQKRSIVSSAPGTTRDAVDTVVKHRGRKITLIDTAGIRRKSKVEFGVEAFSVVRSLSAIDRADVVALMLDATQSVADQDQKIAAKINDSGKAVVIVVNKWDLVEDRSSSSMNQFLLYIERELGHIKYAETVFTSAITGQRVVKIVESAERAFAESRKRVATGIVNQVVNEAVALTPPPSSKRGRRLRVYYSSQVSVAPPTFVLFVNEEKLLTDSYHVYLERKLREAFGFKGTAIRVLVRAKSQQK